MRRRSFHPFTSWVPTVRRAPSPALVGLFLAAMPGRTLAQRPDPVFDVHLHASFTPAAIAAARAMLDSLNISRAVLIGNPSQLVQQGGDTARFIRSLIFPCEGGTMTSSGAECFDEGREFPDTIWLRRALRSGDIRGFGEITAQYMGVAPNDARLAVYYRLAEEFDVPIGIHLGIGPPGVAYAESRFPPRKSPRYDGQAGSPLLLEPVLVRHPTLRVYVMHAAWPFLDEMIYMLYMHPQLYADISVLQYAVPRSAYYSYLKALVEGGFASRLMWGSDGGPRFMRAGVEAILKADFLTEGQKRDILYNNAARFFNAGAAAAPRR